MPFSPRPHVLTIYTYYQLRPCPEYYFHVIVWFSLWALALAGRVVKLKEFTIPRTCTGVSKFSGQEFHGSDMELFTTRIGQRKI